jgi:hypothetical protein
MMFSSAADAMTTFGMHHGVHHVSVGRVLSGLCGRIGDDATLVHHECARVVHTWVNVAAEYVVTIW